MKEINKYEELIYLVLDGEASEIERESLFNAMAKDVQLQKEFQTALLLNKSAENIGANSAVPDDLTNGLFAKAGLNYTPSNYDNVIVQSVKSGINTFNILNGIGMALLGLIVGVSLIKTVESEENLTPNIFKYERNIALVEPIVDIDNLNNVKEEDAINTIATVSSEEITTQEDDNNTIKYVEITIPDKVELNSNFYEISHKNEIAKTNYQVSQQYQNEELDLINSNIKTYGDFGLDIEVRNSMYRNLPKATIQPSEISNFNNTNLFLYYELSPNWKIGAGVRQETFFVRYNAIENGESFIFEQQPNLTNYELSLRYIALSSYRVKPYLQLNFGGGEFGYTYRSELGTEINIHDNFSLTLALDYAFLSFMHDRQNHTSRKLGLNYGINYKL